MEDLGLRMFIASSAILALHNKLNEYLQGIATVKEVVDGGDDEDEDEDKDEDEKSRIRRIASDFSIGMTRNQSVDDLIKNFEWELCTAGKTTVMLARMTGYFLLAVCMLGGFASYRRVRN